MENKNTSVFLNALIWGVITGLVLIVYSVILYMVDKVFDPTLGYLRYLILVAGLVVAVISYRDNVLEGEISFGKALGFGVLICVISGFLGAIYNYLLYTLIDPDLQGKLFEFAMNKSLERGATESQLEPALPLIKILTGPIVTSIGELLNTALVGTILSLIVAAIFKKESEKIL